MTCHMHKLTICSHTCLFFLDLLQGGGFYLYPSLDSHREALSHLGVTTSKELATWLLNEWNIVALPGEAFGENPERLTLRLAVCDFDGPRALENYRNAWKKKVLG